MVEKYEIHGNVPVFDRVIWVDFLDFRRNFYLCLVRENVFVCNLAKRQNGLFTNRKKNLNRN